MRNSTRICVFVIFLHFLFSTVLFSQPTWQEINPGGPPIGATDKIDFFNLETGWQIADNGVSKTSDGGLNWEVKTPYPSMLYEDMYFINETTGWITEKNHLMKTTNGGDNWIFQTISLPNGTYAQTHEEIYFYNNHTGYVVSTYYNLSGQAIIYRYTLSKTTNSGESWFSVYESPGSTDADISFFSVKFFDDNNGIGLKKIDSSPSVYPMEVLKSSNGGINWTKINSFVFPTLGRGKAFYLNEDTMWIIHYSNKIYKSVNSGVDWELQLAPTEVLNDIFFTSQDIGYLPTSSGRMYWTSNGGSNWQLNDIDTNKYLRYVYFLNKDTGFAGSGSYTLRTFDGSVVNIHPISSEIPNSFALKQNYPNPFNPSTKIRFDIPHSKNVKLSVFNSLGQQVAVLVNEQLQPGIYEYEFIASDYSSGIYFYRLDAEGFTETKRMVLVK